MVRLQALFNNRGMQHTTALCGGAPAGAAIPSNLLPPWPAFHHSELRLTKVARSPGTRSDHGKPGIPVRLG